MAEIRPLFSYVSVGEGPVAEVVEEIEKLLKAAQSGDIKGIAVAYVDRGDFVHTAIRKGEAVSSVMGGAVGVLFHDFMSSWANR